MTHLFVIDVATRATRTLTSGAFTVGSFSWSPDGKSIAFDHRINPELKNGGSADISIVTVADASIRKLVTQDGPDTNPVWSPDGSRIAFQTAMANPAFFYANSLIATVPAAGGAPTVLSSAFDEDPQIVGWKPAGLFFAASARTYAYLYKLDPADEGDHENCRRPIRRSTRASRSRGTARRSRSCAPTPERCRKSTSCPARAGLRKRRSSPT